MSGRRAIRDVSRERSMRCPKSITCDCKPANFDLQSGDVRSAHAEPIRKGVNSSSINGENGDNRAGFNNK